MSEMTLTEQAQAWARIGPVLPVEITSDSHKGFRGTDKRPLLTHGHNDASSDPATVAALPWGRANGIGLALDQPGLVVVDIDTADGHSDDGYATLAQLEAEHGRLPDAPTVLTASGGEHRYFRAPGVRGRSGVAPGIDVKGADGWVVVAGEITWPDGHTGRWCSEASADILDGAEPPPLPAWFADLIGRGTSNGTGNRGPWQHLDRDALLGADLEALEALERLGGHSAHQRGDGSVGITRPGKTAGISATIGYLGPGTAKVWSSNWPPLAEGVYDADRLVAVAETGTDPGDDRDGSDADTSDDAGSWEPIDLAAVLAGDLTTPEPTMLHGRDQDLALIYPGCVNGLHGDSGAGKSWLTLAAAAQEIEAGHQVMIIDYEATPVEAVARLRTLGVAPERIAAQVIYIRPTEATTRSAVSRLVEMITTRGVTLCVIDSLGEAFGLDGVNEDKDNEVGPWLRQMVRRLADAGAGVLTVDHSTKAGDNPLHPSGSKRKRAGITGASYLVDVIAPFTREQPGKLKLTTAKDRHGHHPRGQIVATVDVTPYPDGGVTVNLWAPPSDGGDNPDQMVLAAARKIVTLVHDEGRAMSGREITTRVDLRCRNETKRAAVEMAVGRGWLTEETGPRNARMHSWRADPPADGGTT